jgi:hypothetical protein
VLTKTKFFEEEAKRKAETVDNGEDNVPQQDAPIATNANDSQEDDVFYDSDADQHEE